MPRAILGVMPRDADLLRIVDAAMADAAGKSGAWLACKPGCTPCCFGPFPINALDALRLRDGLGDLGRQDPDRAARVVERSRRSVARLEAAFPGDTLRRVLEEDDAGQDEPCPALDPASGRCDLYGARPLTCRVFGPAVRCGSGATAVCELCYVGATGEQIAQCQVEVDPDALEGRLLDQLEETAGLPAETIVAFALAPPPRLP